MEVNEVIKAKRDAEATLLKTLEDLERSTGMHVSAVYVAHRPQIMGIVPTSLADVRIDLKLED